MSEPVLTVHTADLNALFGSRPFIALPQEEIDRLHASIEVSVTEHELAEQDPSITQLMAFVAIHHNYSWLTCCSSDSPEQEAHARSVGFAGHLHPEGNNGLFLDESLNASAREVIDKCLAVPMGYDIRLAGLLCDGSTRFGRMHCGLVYVARLRQPGVEDLRKGESQIRFCGTEELRQERNRFEAWSRMVIDHLIAL
jgi:predicted NUDIX family phosphoesterase